MATFQFLRVSLVAHEQGDLFAKKFDPSDREIKKEFLEDVFDQDRWDFTYGSKQFSLLKEHRVGNLIVFRFGKLKVELGHDGPDRHFPPAFFENWELAWAIFDIDSSSQLFIVQNNIASPRPMVISLFDRIESSRLDSPYEFKVEYLSYRSEFWDAVNNFSGQITKLEFSFLPPNALGLAESIKEIIVSAKTQLGADQTTFLHVNKDGGLHPNKEDEYTNAALETVSKGGGSAKMKVGRKTVYSSSKSKKTVNVDNAELPEGNQDKEQLTILAKSLSDERDRP